MMRYLRPALPAFILILSGALGVPAIFAQSSKGPAKRKPTASKASTASAKSSKASTKAPVSAKTSTAKVASSKNPAAKPGTSSPAPRGNKKYSSRSRRQPGQKAPTSERITEIQTALAGSGSYPGTPTGKWDDGTVQAMRKFQASRGLNPTGKLDARTLQKLGLGSQTAGVAAPIAPPGAVSRLTSSVATPAVSDDLTGRP